MTRFFSRFLIFLSFTSLSTCLFGAAPRLSKTLTGTTGKSLVVVQFATGLPASEMDRILWNTGVRIVENPDLIPVDRLIEASPEALKALSERPELVLIYPP